MEQYIVDYFKNNSIHSVSQEEWVIIGVFVFIQLWVMIWYLFLIKKKSFQIIPNEIVSPERAVSVIIAAKNELQNLKILIPKLMEQDYEFFEVIVVDDCSWDGTRDFLLEAREMYPKLHICRTVDDAYEGNFIGKKLALTIGIKAAKYEKLLFTDADCIPHSNQWIRESSQAMETHKMVLQYGAYETKSSILNWVLRWETLKTALHYGVFAHLGKAYMGVGRNLAYHRDIFFKIKGFSSHIFIRSGDDDLFVQDYAKTKKPSIGVQFSAGSKTISKAPNSWKEWFFQKRRHFTTSDEYSFGLKIQLAFNEGIHFLFFLSPVLALLLPAFVELAFVLWFFAYLIFILKIAKVSKWLHERFYVFFLPFAGLLVFLFRFVVLISNWISKPKNWNGK
ncbi:MAG: glycosyltransferase [Flavobacteriales bacterium]|jgi:glycosyltransferase involved in cell wall biosynthesis|nr:glycosyltransferase [Flavobacteriales bacterium]